MRDDFDHLREEAQRARWWAIAVFDPRDRERIEEVARKYEEMAERIREEADSY